MRAEQVAPVPIRTEVTCVLVRLVSAVTRKSLALTWTNALHHQPVPKWLRFADEVPSAIIYLEHSDASAHQDSRATPKSPVKVHIIFYCSFS